MSRTMFSFAPFGHRSKTTVTLRSKNLSDIEESSSSEVEQFHYLSCNLGNAKHKRKKEEKSSGGKSYNFNKPSKPMRVYYTPRRSTSFDMDQLSEESAYSALSNNIQPSDVHINICNTFWRPNLCFSQYKFGDGLMDFDSLWPEKEFLDGLLLEAFQSTSLRKSVADLCLLVVRCGPVKVVKSLIKQNIIGINQTFENGGGMLHVACISQNEKMISYLCASGIRPDILDNNGRTADKVCFNSKLKKFLEMKKNYSSSQKHDKEQNGLLVKRTPASVHEKETIFKMANNPKDIDELLIKLQTLQFNVNREINGRGDYLIHTATKKGLCQLQLLYNLIKIHGANMEQHNSKGMTPLMIAADIGDCILVDVLLCVFGCNPNTENPTLKWTPLHYAAKSNHTEVINYLVKRGADMNLEDSCGRRPDDVAFFKGMVDSKQTICNHREARINNLQELIDQGHLEGDVLRETDLFTTDVDGDTLLMKAVKVGSLDSVKILLEWGNCCVNAQHEKTGRTALSLAAEEGFCTMIRLLLLKGANPSIGDIEGLLPLHIAVKCEQFQAVDALTQQQIGLHGLQKAFNLTKSPAMQRRIKHIISRRQTEMVNPELFECALTGNAEKLYCMLEDGDDTNPSSGVGDWPMYLAAGNGHLEVMQLLYERHGDIHRQHPSTQNTVLHVACSEKYSEMVRYLLYLYKTQESKQGFIGIPNPDSTVHKLNAEGKNALQVAGEKGFLRIVKLLLHHGATTSVLDSNGKLFKCQEYQGVQVLIENKRNEHMRLLIDCIADKTKKGYKNLIRLWLPKFDHNLRSSRGDTPLMIAARLGKLDIINLFLESAVYQIDRTEYSQILRQFETSDGGDSGTVLESSLRDYLPAPTQTSTPFTRQFSTDRPIRRQNIHEPKALFTSSLDETGIHNSFSRLHRSSKNDSTLSPDGEGVEACKVAWEENESSQQEEASHLLEEASDSSTQGNNISQLMESISLMERGTVLTGNKVSHVCACSQLDGATAVHRAIEGGDFVDIVIALLAADQSAVNIQDRFGKTPLHLACSLGRRRIVQYLLKISCTDLNCRTLDGQLADELTTNKKILKMFESVRETQTSSYLIPSISQPSSYYIPGPGSATGSALDFDQINTRFQMMKSRQTQY